MSLVYILSLQRTVSLFVTPMGHSSYITSCSKPMVPRNLRGIYVSVKFVSLYGVKSALLEQLTYLLPVDIIIVFPNNSKCVCPIIRHYGFLGLENT